ncbi:MAG: hypothetical protein ACPGVG_14385 [Mycobacterium sp.]
MNDAKKTPASIQDLEEQRAYPVRVASRLWGVTQFRVRELERRGVLARVPLMGDRILFSGSEIKRVTKLLFQPKPERRNSRRIG